MIIEQFMTCACACACAYTCTCTHAHAHAHAHAHVHVHAPASIATPRSLRKLCMCMLSTCYLADPRREVPNNNHPFNTNSVADRCLVRYRRHAGCSAPPTRRQTRALSTGTYTHEPPTEGGDYAAGALSVVAPSLAPFRPVRCLYGAPPVPACPPHRLARRERS